MEYSYLSCGDDSTVELEPPNVNLVKLQPNGSVCNQLGQILPHTEIAKIARFKLAKLLTKHNSVNNPFCFAIANKNSPENPAKALTFIVDIQTNRLLHSDSKFQSFLGYSPKEVLELTLSDLIGSNDENLEHNIQHILLEKHYLSKKCQFRHKQGFLIDVEMTLALALFQGAEVLCISVSDMSKPTEMQATLTHHEGEFWAFVESVNCAVFICQDETLCYVNPALEALSGYAREDLLGMRLWNALNSQALGRLYRLERQQQQPVFLQYELDVIIQSGHERRLNIVMTPVQYGGRYAILGVALDQTKPSNQICKTGLQ